MRKYNVQRSPFIVPTVDGKVIKEHFGHAINGNVNISTAHMVAPSNWNDLFQTPKFDEYTFKIRGEKQFIIEEGESIKIEKNTKVQYSNSFTDVCKYIAICKPAFSMELDNRDE
ncbi:cupin domain-containing protein [Psychroserpens sp.]